ncbi:MAG: autotransporter-associated beta strand repeat-containing protein, partial [Kiritimatiellae bacterium]|nr:autotransporter-associated beta strand repeat-containing protein [Kiritimatiellia bacterium]
MRKYVVLVSAAACFGAFGVDVKWSNSGTGSWNTPSNWQGDALPGAGDAAINDVGGTILVSDGVTAAARILRTGTESGKGGHLLITGGSLTLPSIASQIGSVAGGSGTVEMTGGELYVGQFQVGAYGTGSMILSGGTVYSEDWCCIGRYPGGVGTLTVAGSGVWECQRLSVFASEQGTGTITIENGGELRFAATNIREFVIGNQSSGVGVLRLNTGGTLKVAGVDARYATDTFVLDGGMLACMDTGSHANFIRTSGGGGKFQIGPNGGTIDTSTGTQTVALDIDDLPGASGGPLVKKGTGTLVLSKGGTFTGGFTVEEGTLSVASAANLPGCTTAPITIKSGATLAIGGEWTEDAFVAMTNRADFVVEDGGTLVAPATFTDDYLVSVPSGTLTLSGLNLTARLVKTGGGTLELAGYNTLAGGVVVSNGTLAANYETSGLADTHVHLAGPSTSSYCYLGIHGDSFTAPIAASGAGTFSFGPFTGIKAMDPGPFTLNIGGDGRTIKWPFHGDWIFVPNGGPFTVKNTLDINGQGNCTIKGSGSNPVVLEGGVTNSSTSAGYFNYWTGSVVLPARAGGARHESYRWYWRAGDVLVTNATIHSVNDFLAGERESANSSVIHVTLKDSVKTSGGGWDYICGSTGTVLTVDGGSYTARNRLNVGYTVSGKTGRLVITNNAAVTASEFYMQSGSLEIDSGSLTANGTSVIGDGNIAWAGRGPVSVTQRGGNLTFNGSATIGNQTGSVARVVMSDGSMFMKDGYNFQIGARGNGTFVQTGGDISMSAYACVGRYPGGVGEYRLHGGTFTHRVQGNGKNLFFVAEDGTGTVSIANGGRLTVTNANGICIASTATSKGTLILSPGGTFEATTAYGGSGDDTFVFNGGTFKMLSNAKASTVIQSSVNRRVATPLGGAIDTAGKGDFTLPVALTAAARAEELAETITHRWRFDDGSLADCVGDSDATVGGTVNWTDGAVRLLGTANGTSCINLGADVLPAGGRGATIEMWVTQRERRSWARIVCAGPSATFWLSSNRGGASKEGWLSISGSSGAYSHQGYELENGKTYHMAVVFDQQPDDTWRFTVSLRDATTGELIDASSSTANASWSFDKIVQSGGIWLGRSAAAADPDPYMDYHDVRIYNRAMTADQLAASCAAGPDAHFYLMKKGAGMLTLTGANTYKAGTGVDGGTLTLASGATLPATEMWAG